MHLNRKGQSQLLSIIILGNVMLAMLLGVMEYSNQVKIVSIKESRVTEMRKALDAAHRMLLQIYREGVCDPVALNRKINFINTAGQQTGTLGNRQVNFSINSRDYLVSIGPVARLVWAVFDDLSFPGGGLFQGEDVVGVSQDAVVEVWTNFGTTRVTQKASLINNCIYPCAYTYGGPLNSKMGMCAIAADPIIGYNIVNPSTGTYTPDTGDGSNVHPPVAQTYTPTGTSPLVRTGSYWPGNMAVCIGGAGCSCTNENDEPTLAGTFSGSPRLDVRDLTVFRDHLRSGNKQATCDARIRDSDLNSDGMVNENDLILLEKFLRGYIYRLPIVTDQAFTAI